VDARVVYLDDCPCWRAAEERLGEALTRIGRPELPVTLVEVRPETEARVSGFAGSPTIVIDGVDLFPGSAVRTEWPAGCTRVRPVWQGHRRWMIWWPRCERGCERS